MQKICLFADLNIEMILCCFRSIFACDMVEVWIGQLDGWWTILSTEQVADVKETELVVDTETVITLSFG